jgi:hypothetical protein
MLDDAPVVHHRNLVRQPRHYAHVVGDQQQALAAAGDNLFQQIENAPLRHGIEVGGGFIGEDKGRLLSRARAIIIRCNIPPLISKG